MAHRYVAKIGENSSVGTPLVFGAGQKLQVSDHDQGVDGVFTLTLVGDGGAFQVTPAAAQGSTTFSIAVRNPAAIDYERASQITFQIVARQVPMQITT